MSSRCNVFVARQILLEIGVCLISFTTGLAVSFPSILNPATVTQDGDIQVTSDQVSWIATCLGLGAVVGYIIVPIIFQIFGRKMANIVTNISILSGSLILYVAEDIYTLAFARILQGPSIGGTIISVISLCECVCPKRRGYFIVINKVALALGNLGCHSLVFVLNWRHIALLGALANLISIIIYSFSAESPLFFAMRGQFDTCTETFQWYRGNSIHAQKELKELVVAQKENLRMNERRTNIGVLKSAQHILLTKEFQKSFCIVTLAILCLDSCGRYFVQTYITQIITEITKNTSLAMYISVAIDCFSIFALCISSVLVKHFNRRTLLSRLGFCSVFLMFMVSFTIILRDKLNLFQDINWLTPAIILLHSFITNLSVIPIAHAIISEIFSLDQKGLGLLLSGIVFLIFFNLIMKLTPTMMDRTGVEGIYSIYGLFLFVFLVLLLLILPETKDKTLQQIEDEIKCTVRDNTETELLKVS